MDSAQLHTSRRGRHFAAVIGKRNLLVFVPFLFALCTLFFIVQRSHLLKLEHTLPHHSSAAQSKPTGEDSNTRIDPTDPDRALCPCPPENTDTGAQSLQRDQLSSQPLSSEGGGSVVSLPPVQEADQSAGQQGLEGQQQQQLERIFIFIGILSGRGYRHRRLAVREAWANKAQYPGVSVCKFILSEDERTPQVQKEVDTHGDIVFVKEKTTYKSILYKTYYVLEYAARHYQPAFVLKTDDDAFVNLPAVNDYLRSLCQDPQCRNERLYVGRMARHSEVLLQPGHKWNNLVFFNHTGLKTYPNYMMGGGYVLSGDIVAMLVDMNDRLKLKFTPIEDATLGFWLMAMDLRHVDQWRFWTWAAPCCFKAPVRREGQRIVTRFQLQEDMEYAMCGAEPWLILHKIDSPTKMRFIGNRIAACPPMERGSTPSPQLQQEQVQQLEAKQQETEQQQQQVSGVEGQAVADEASLRIGAQLQLSQPVKVVQDQ